MICTICAEPIVLTPSDKARADKYGGSPSDYAEMFSVHSNCIIKVRKEQVSILMLSLRKDPS